MFSDAYCGSEHWIKSGDANSGEYSSFIDTSSIVNMGDKVVAAWTKKIYTKPQSESLFLKSYTTAFQRLIVRCADTSIAIVEQIKLDSEQKTIFSENLPESKWQFYSLPSDTLAHVEATSICNLSYLPSPRLDSSDNGDWRPLLNGNKNVTIDTKSVQSSGYFFIARTRHYIDESTTATGKSFSSLIANFIINCKDQTAAVYASYFRDKNGRVIESVITPFSKLVFNNANTGGDSNTALIGGLCQRQQTDNTKSRESGNTGTGFFVSADGQALTNAHVVRGCKAISIQLPNKKTTPAKIIAEDVRNDLALLKINDRTPSHAQFRTSSAEVGEQVMAIGFPLRHILSSEAIVTSGNINAAAGLGGDISKIQISTPIQPGNSGGPLIDSNGAVVGIITEKLDDLKTLKIIGQLPQNVNFAIKADVAKLFLDVNGVKYSVTNNSKKIDQASLAQKGKSFTVVVDCK